MKVNLSTFRHKRIKLTFVLSLIIFLIISIFVYLGIHQYFALNLPNNDTSNPILYYISPTGNDNNTGTIDSPFATLEKARDVVWATKTSMRASFSGATVYIRGGEYNRPTVFTLSSTDSGTAIAPIKYTAYQQEKPIMRGSQTITGWTPSPGNPDIYQADLATQGLSNLAIKEVYLNGERQILAQTPNYITPNFTQTDPYAGNWYFASQANDCSTAPIDSRVRKTTLIYNQADLSEPILDALKASIVLSPANPAQMEIYPKTEYWNDIRNLASVDTTSGEIGLASNTSYDICQKNRYLLRNFYAALDTNKEWYQDKTQNLLYYMPPHPLTESDQVSVPVTANAVSLNSVAYTSLNGLTFEQYFGNMVTLNGANNISLTNNTIRSSIYSGISIYGWSHDVSVNWNTLYDLGSVGINVETHASYLKNLNSNNIKINNNTIHDVAYNLKGAYAIKTYLSEGVVIGHNEIYNLPRLAIAIYGNDNIVEYNKIYNINLLTNDSGGIYLGARSWIQRGNIIRNNYIKDTNGYGKYMNSDPNGPYRFGFYTSGIYLDDYTSGAEVYNNIVVNATTGCFQNHLGRDNSYTNNICIEGGREQWNQRGQMSLSEDGMVDPSTNSGITSMWDELQTMTTSGYDRPKYFARYPELANVVAPADTKQGEIMVNNTVKNNIFYYPTGPSQRAYSTYNLGTNQSIDNNLFWPGGARTITASRSLAGTSSIATWAGWQGLGFDVHSVVTDPLFHDANVGVDGSMDFSLNSNSPAFSTGFQSIDTSRIGPVKPLVKLNQGRAFTFKNGFTVSGTKSPDVTKIIVNGVENDVAEGSTTWNSAVNLPLGQNNINVSGLDSDGNLSSSDSMSVIRRKIADANNDGKVDDTDFTLLLFNWGSGTQNSNADYNEDGVVDDIDFTILLYYWGQ